VSRTKNAVGFSHVVEVAAVLFWMTVDPLPSDRAELDQPDQKAMSNAKSWDAELAAIRKLAERQNHIVKIGIATGQKAGLLKVPAGRLKRIMALVKTLGVDDVRDRPEPGRAGEKHFLSSPASGETGGPLSCEKREALAVRLALSTVAEKEMAHGQEQAGCNSPAIGLIAAIAGAGGRSRARHPCGGTELRSEP